MLENGFKTITGRSSTYKVRTVPVFYAFASSCGKGNPAGIVCRRHDDLSDEELVGLCSDAKLPTISYIVPIDKFSFGLRWITPNGEFDLCGHGTMAASGYLSSVLSGFDTIDFETRSGRLEVKSTNEFFSMKLPKLVSRSADARIVKSIKDMLDCHVTMVMAAKGDFAAIVESKDFIINFTPDFQKIRNLHCRGFSISAPFSENGSSFDIITRTFMPDSGIDEDQVCVSAHCKLFSYWQERLNKQSIKSFQASENGGELILTEAGLEHLWVQGRSCAGGIIQL